MEKPPVVVRLMDQMKRMAELQQTFEAAGKLMSKADKVKIMNVEKNKLDALKQEQLQEEAAPQAGAVGDGEEPRWGPVLAAAGARKTRSDYVDYPCSQLGSDPNILEHCHYTNFTTGREAVRQSILQNKLFGDMPNLTKESMTTRMAGRVGGAGAPNLGKLDWEFEDGRGLR